MGKIPTVLGSNEATSGISSIFENMQKMTRLLNKERKEAGGVMNMPHRLGEKAQHGIENSGEEMKKAIGNPDKDGRYSTFQRMQYPFRNKDDGTLSYGKIAGAYMGVAAAGRVLSGGGLYKDSDGNTDLIGIPFV